MYKYAVGVFFLLSAVLLGGFVLTRLDLFPIVRIGVDAPMVRLKPEILMQAIEQEVTGGFWGVSLNKIRRIVQQLDWVKTVSVRRVWPNALEIKIEEARPLAYWTRHGVITETGQTIADPQGLYEAWDALPVLQGAPNYFKKLCDILEFFQNNSQALNIRIKKITVSSRSAWRMELQDGILVIFGRNDVDARIHRFLKCYGQIRGQIKDEGKQISYIDMRYRNGIAVGYSPALPFEVSERGF
jgi:cell division protein FtsQ